MFCLNSSLSCSLLKSCHRGSCFHSTGNLGPPIPAWSLISMICIFNLTHAFIKPSQFTWLGNFKCICSSPLSGSFCASLVADTPELETIVFMLYLLSPLIGAVQTETEPNLGGRLRSLHACNCWLAFIIIGCIYR